MSKNDVDEKQRSLLSSSPKPRKIILKIRRIKKIILKIKKNSDSTIALKKEEKDNATNLSKLIGSEPF